MTKKRHTQTDPDFKRCSRCTVMLPVSNFRVRVKERGWLQSMCKQCEKDYRKTKQKDWNRPPRTYEQRRNNWYKTKYGISLEEYNLILDNQDYVCITCGEQETSKDSQGKIKPLAVDHDHNTGKIRGLLCDKCNRALGALKDNITYLENAIQYLKDYND